MSNIPRFLRDDENEWKKWKAKKVVQQKDFIVKLPKNYKNKSQRFASKSLNINTPKRSKEVLIKITSSSKHFQALSRHIDYISRDGTLEIITSDLSYFHGENKNISLKKDFRFDGQTIPNRYEEKQEKRQTYNMVFSMKEHSTTPPEKLKQAAFTTLKQAYPDNFFALVFHNDTDNPHCHICLKISKSDVKRIDIKKNDLAHLRAEFAKNLNALGVEAVATSRKKIEQTINLAKRQQILDSLQDKSKAKIKAHHYKVLDFGRANFDFKDKNTPSFFVRYLTPKGDTIIWGKDLERVVDELDIQKGEYVRFGKIGERAEPYSFKKKIQNKWYEVQTARKIPVWDASVAGRAEKNFTKLPPVEITQTLKELQKERIDNGKRKYTKREWAIYYADKRRGVHKSSADAGRGLATAKSTNDLQKLSQIPMVWQPNSNQMLLHLDAQHKLERGGQGQPNHAVRWTDNRTYGATREK